INQTMRRLVFIILLSLSANIQAQDWEWACIFENSEGINIHSKILCVDDKENSYVTIYLDPINYFNNTKITLNKIEYRIRGKNDVFLAKINSAGDVLWIKQLGGLGNYREVITGIHYFKGDNSLYAAGNFGGGSFYYGDDIVYHSSSESKCLILKISETGSIIWIKSWIAQPLISNAEIKYLNEDGSFIFTGTNTEIIEMPFIGQVKGSWIAKYDNDGELVWIKKPFTSLSDSNQVPVNFKSIDKIEDNYFVHAEVKGEYLLDKYGNVHIFDPIQYCTFKFDSEFNFTGDVFRRIKTPEHSDVILNFKKDKTYFFVGVAVDGKIYMGNDTLILGDRTQYYLMKVNEHGDILNTILLKINLSSEIFYFTRITAIFSERTESIYIFAKSPENSTIGFNEENVNVFKEITSVAIRINSELEIQGLRFFGSYWPHYAYYNLLCSNGNLYFADMFKNKLHVGNIQYSTDTWFFNTYVAKIPEFTGFLRENNQIDDERLLVFPNPGEGICRVNIPSDLIQEKELQVLVTSSDGRLVKQFALNPFNGQFTIDISQASVGVYYIQLSSSKRNYYGKVVKMN
ncbi:MAG: T9SS type A sorting domain-containing protein, partial [Flavobacteriales bacterium]